MSQHVWVTVGIHVEPKQRDISQRCVRKAPRERLAGLALAATDTGKMLIFHGRRDGKTTCCVVVDTKLGHIPERTERNACGSLCVLRYMYLCWPQSIRAWRISWGHKGGRDIGLGLGLNQG